MMFTYDEEDGMGLGLVFIFLFAVLLGATFYIYTELHPQNQDNVNIEYMYDDVIHYEVQPGDTLLRVYGQQYPMAEVSADQVRHLLLLTIVANPEAFEGCNPEKLRPGAVLSLPKEF